MSQSERDAAYDKPVVDDDRASVISRSTLEEGRFNGRNSVDTLDWYDPETYDGDGIPQTSQEEQPLVKPTL